MNKLQLCETKKLKLTNVLKYIVSLETKQKDTNIVMEQMRAYIRAKGAMPVGPMIQYTRMFINANNALKVEIVLMLQCNHFIENVEEPYSMEPIFQVPNAMYCRYTGPVSKIKFAYDKIHLEAFENDIALENCNYTVYVSTNVEEDTMIADVFVPRMGEM